MSEEPGVIYPEDIPVMVCGHIAAHRETIGHPQTGEDTVVFICPFCVVSEPMRSPILGPDGRGRVIRRKDLVNRVAVCSCGKKILTTTPAPFILHRPGETTDIYYCGHKGMEKAIVMREIEPPGEKIIRLAGRKLTGKRKGSLGTVPPDDMGPV